MGKNFAIETGSKIDYIPGEPWNVNEQQAETAWRAATRLYFLSITVRRTTEEEDARLGNPANCLNNIGATKN